MSRLSRRLWWAVLVTGVATLLLSLVVVVRTTTAPDDLGQVPEVRGSAAVATAPTTEQQATVGTRVGAAPAVPPRRERVARPSRLRVPSVGIDMAVRATGVGRDRQMRLPADPRTLGWYRYGPAPGSGGGSAVLAGHVDSRTGGVGPLARLAGVSPGDTVRVTSGKGRSRAYRVDSIERFDRQRLPAAVFARSGPERLRLVTCTGPWLPERGGYQQNLVVTAVPVS